MNLYRQDEELRQSLPSTIASLLKPTRGTTGSHKQHEYESSPPPSIIITWNAKEILSAFRSYSVDVLDWEIGLTSLFDSRPPHARIVSPRGRDQDSTKQERKRSRSPSFRNDPSTSRSSGILRGSVKPPRVYVIDMQDIWAPLATLASIPVGDKSLREMARILRIECDPEGWSAGRDLEYVFYGTQSLLISFR